MIRPGLIFISLLIISACSRPDNYLPETQDVIHWVDGKIDLTEVELDTFFEVNHSPIILYGRAYFFYKGEAKKVAISGDFNQWSLDSLDYFNQMDHGYWTASLTIEPKAQLEYKFRIDENQWITDPFNPTTSRGGFGTNSLLTMSEYNVPEELSREPSQIKFQRSSFELPSQFFRPTLEVFALTPTRSGEVLNDSFPVVFFQDGAEYLEVGQFERAAANLIEMKVLDPFIGIFVVPHDREALYAGELTEEYALYYADELLPYVLDHFPVTKDTSKWVVMGNSYGGNSSALICQLRPDLFKNCALQSPVLFPNDYEVVKAFRNLNKMDIRISATWGNYELINDSLEVFVNMLSNKGYFIDRSSYPEGHNWIFWSSTYDDVLKPFIPNTEPSE